MSDSTASESALPPTDPKFGLMFIAAEHLIPLFKIGTIDFPLARRMAVSAIEAYQPENRSDYINAARTIAFSITAIALLGKTASDDMTMPEKMRAFGRANTLNRCAVQSERTMIERRRQQQARPPAEQPVPQSEPPATNLTIEDMAIDDAELHAAISNVMEEYMALERHQPDWNSPADKVARQNNELEHADFSSQPENALGMVLPGAMDTPIAPPQPVTPSQAATIANTASVSPIRPLAGLQQTTKPVEAIRYNTPASRPHSQPAPHKAEILRTIATHRDAEHSVSRPPR